MPQHVLYGIPNCDTVKKARVELEACGIAYQFHDFKKAGIDSATLKRWCREFGHEQLLNQRGTTWRKLAASQRDNLTEAKAIQLMMAQPSVIKRPVLDTGTGLLLGFKAGSYRHLV